MKAKGNENSNNAPYAGGNWPGNAFCPPRLDVEGEFAEQVRWKIEDDKWQQVRWTTPVPSRLKITLPEDTQQQIRETKQRFHELGLLSDTLETIRARLESEAIEESELRRVFREASPASDFDPSFVNWQPTYDRFFYSELLKRKFHLYFFRKEYIIETETRLVIEIPSRGHATYLFVLPRNFRTFMTSYAKATKDEIRMNKNGIAEKLGFVARIIHGQSRDRWLLALRLHLGEAGVEVPT